MRTRFTCRLQSLDLSNIKKLAMYYAQEPEEASLAAVHLSVKNISECCFFANVQSRFFCICVYIFEGGLFNDFLKRNILKREKASRISPFFLVPSKANKNNTNPCLELTWIGQAVLDLQQSDLMFYFSHISTNKHSGTELSGLQSWQLRDPEWQSLRPAILIIHLPQRAPKKQLLSNALAPPFFFVTNRQQIGTPGRNQENSCCPYLFLKSE